MSRCIGLAVVIGSLSLLVIPVAAAQQKFPTVDQPGVSDKDIRVAALFTDENDPTAGKFESSVDGAEAYFAYVNKTEGGIYGRKLVVDTKHDDRLGNNRPEVQAILSQDDVFAVVPVSAPLFAGANLLVEAGVPTFGWHISAEWGSETNTPGPPNLFAQVGSYYCVPCVNPKAENWLSKKLGLKRVGVVAYGVPQSADCADGLEKTFKQYPTAQISFLDKTIPYGTPDYSAQVAQMKEEDVDLVYPCIDAQATVLLAKEMTRQGLDAVIVSPSLYNRELVEENKQFLEGDYVQTTFVPVEVKKKPEGLTHFLTWMKRTGGEVNEQSIIGWINANQFVEGLKAAGPQFTRQKVIDAINQSKDFTADGLIAGIDWTVAHQDDYDCFSVVKIVDGKFKPVYNKSGSPFICLPDGIKKIPLDPPDGSKPADRM